MTEPGRRRRARRTTAVGIAGNTALFVVKGAIGFASGSIALLSDAFNSLVDVVASVAIWYSVEVAHREPDVDHPYGHHRAETIAALGVAIFTAILGFEIGRTAVERLIRGPGEIGLAGWALGALVFSMAGNLLLARYLRSRGEALESPAILANAVECENDIWTSLAALLGVGGAVLGWPAVDPIAGMVVGGWIVWGGYRFGRENIDYLMGKSPGGELLERIRSIGLAIDGVRGVHDVRAHYVGHRIHVEIHVEVDQELRTLQSHDVAAAVGRAVEALPGVDRAFVHVDPVLRSTRVLETLAARERLASGIYEELARRHADRAPLAAMWQALATNALVRAERLGVARRLRGAGWHFADTELDPAGLERDVEELRGLAERVGKGRVGVAEAVGIAGSIESPAAREAVRRATTPQDPALAGPLASATPPPPSGDHLRLRIERARETEADGEVRRALERLETAVNGPAD